MSTSTRWIGYTDGGARISNPGLAACAFVLLKDRTIHHSQGKFLGDSVTNNEAEYQGLISILEHASKNGVNGILIHSDSELMVKQVQGIYKVKQHGLMNLCDYANMLLVRTSCKLKWVPRELNSLADDLVNETLDAVQIQRRTALNAPAQEKDQ